MGFQGVEIWGNRPHLFVPDVKKGEIRELREYVKSLGMEISCFTPSRGNPRSPVNISSSSDKIRRESVEYLKECVRCAADLGTNVMCVVPGYYLYGESKNVGFRHTVQSIKELVSCAEENNITIALENMTEYESNVVCRLSDVIGFLYELMSEVRTENVGILLDVGHIHVSRESSIDYIKRLGKRIAHVHINDNDGRSDAHLIPGEGNYNF